VLPIALADHRKIDDLVGDVLISEVFLRSILLRHRLQ
jgi:hypothetical protein